MRKRRNPYYWNDLAEDMLGLFILVVLVIWAASALVSWVIDLFT